MERGTKVYKRSKLGEAGGENLRPVKDRTSPSAGEEGWKWSACLGKFLPKKRFRLYVSSQWRFHRRRVRREALAAVFWTSCRV